MKNIKKKTKKQLEKLKTGIYIGGVMFCSTLVQVSAKTPKFNEDAAKQEAKNWLDPLMSYALWIIPAAGLCRIAWAGIMWYQKDEQEREQNPFHRTATVYLKWTLILEMLPVVFKIFGLVSDL